MICDLLENAASYHRMGNGIGKALSFLRDTDLTSLADGKYEIDGADIFAVVASYDTRPDDLIEWEVHRRYIDVQYVAEGTEIIGYADKTLMKPKDGYSEEKDVEYLEGTGGGIECPQGMFAIFFPNDAHKPGIISGRRGTVKKIVVKVSTRLSE